MMNSNLPPITRERQCAKHRRHRLMAAGCLAIAFLTFSAAFAQTDIESRVHEFTLANGLHGIVYVDSSAPVVSCNVFYKVGAYDEPLGSTGISHMLEHMTFKHTDMYRPGDFDRIVDSAGGVNNGFTSTYYTGYYEDFANDRWDLALKLEAARMGSCVFLDSEFESEHQVVSEERRLQENRPSSELYEQFEAAAFLVNPQRNPIIGWPCDIRAYTADAAREWYEKYYNPANAVLVVAGDVTPEEVKARAERHFGRFKGNKVERTDWYDAEPKQNGERRVEVSRRVGVPYVMVGFHSPGIRDSAYYVAEVASGIIGRGRSSRLYRKLVTELGLATSVYAYNSVQRDPGLFRIGVTPKAESLIPEIERAIQVELDRVATELVADRELGQVRNTVIADEMFQRDDISDMAYILATNHIIFGTWREITNYPEQVTRVTKEQVRDFCKACLVPDNRTTAILLPERKAER